MVVFTQKNTDLNKIYIYFACMNMTEQCFECVGLHKEGIQEGIILKGGA